MTYFFRSVAIALLICSSVDAEEWPQFRGPSSNGVSDAKNVPSEWNATDHVKWKAPIPGSGWSSPVLSQGKLYLTTAVKEKDEAVSLRVVCVDAADGNIVWDVEVLRPTPEAVKQIHFKNSLASPTPVLSGDRLFVHFGHMGTAALDLKGNVVWRQTSLVFDPRHGNGGSPVLVDDLLVFNCDAFTDPFVVALDRATGEVRWRTPRFPTTHQQFSFSTPTVIDVGGQPQIISPGSGLVGAYDPRDGREIWRVHYDKGFSVVPRPVYAHGLLFVATGYGKAKLLAIDPVHATGDATADHVAWTHEKGVPFTPSVLVVGDELYFVSDAGVASCLDARTHKVHWTKRLGGDFSASPIFADGRIYFLNENGVTTVIQAGTEYESIAKNALEERTLASPVPADDALYLRSESHLWRIEN